MGVLTVLHGLGIRADTAREPLNQNIKSVSCTPSPMIGPILSSTVAPTQEGRFRRAYIETILPMLSRLDRFLRGGIPRIEAADVAGHEKARSPRSPHRRLRSQSATVEAIGFSRKTCLPSLEARPRLAIGVLIPHRRDAHRFESPDRRASRGSPCRSSSHRTFFATSASRSELRVHTAVDLHVRDRCERLTMFLAEPAEAQNRMLQFLHQDSYLLHFTFLMGGVLSARLPRVSPRRQRHRPTVEHDRGRVDVLQSHR
jgi:hypothetical protein